MDPHATNEVRCRPGLKTFELFMTIIHDESRPCVSIYQVIITPSNSSKQNHLLLEHPHQRQPRRLTIPTMRNPMHLTSKLYSPRPSLTATLPQTVPSRWSSSNSRWKQRQGRDMFAREAKVQGLKSRAAFKLLEVRALLLFREKILANFVCLDGFEISLV